MSIHRVNLQEAEGHLADLFKLVEQGEEVVITRKDGTAIRLVMSEPPRKRRIAGLHRGKVHMNDDFDDYLGDDFWLGGDK